VCPCRDPSQIPTPSHCQKARARFGAISGPLGMLAQTDPAEHWPFGFIQQRTFPPVTSSATGLSTQSLAASHQWDGLALLPFGLGLSLSSALPGTAAAVKSAKTTSSSTHSFLVFFLLLSDPNSRKPTFIFALFNSSFLRYSLCQVLSRLHSTHRQNKMRPLQMLLLLLVPLLMVSGSVSSIFKRFSQLSLKIPL